MTGRIDNAALAGLRILVVEDDPLIGMLEEDLLVALGCRVVGPVARVADALKIAAQEELDGAILDVNLGAEEVYPVAERLARDRVPFVFVSGYGGRGLPRAFAGRPMIQKPFNPATFGRALLAALGLAKTGKTTT